MFASRDQENLVHGHQTAAAAKPLNQGVTGLAPKTPGPKAPKTPFKIPLNDENGALRGGKTILQAKGKGAENVLATGKKQGDVDKQAFITPIAPRNRAPLGMKTTNAKARPLQTAGNDDPLPKTQKRSGSARRQKIKVQQATPVNVDTNNESHDFEEREIEYMPPRSIDLPDDPDDIFPPNQTYPMFEGANLTRGWWQHSAKFVEEEDEDERERKEAEEKARYDKMADDLVNKSIEQETYMGWDIPEYPGAETVIGLRNERGDKAKRDKESFSMASKKPVASKGPSTLNARSAVVALSQPSKFLVQPRFAAPTIAAKAKAPSSIVSSKKTITREQSESSTMRHASATAASRTTLGFSKGRAASSSLRSLPSANRSSSLITNNNRTFSSSNRSRLSAKDQPDDNLPFPKSKIDPSSPSFDMELWMQARALGISNGEGEDEDEALPAWMKAPAGGMEEEDEFAEFQLVVPEF